MSPSGPYRLASSELSFLHPQSLGLSRGHFYFAQRGHYHFAATWQKNFGRKLNRKNLLNPSFSAVRSLMISSPGSVHSPFSLIRITVFVLNSPSANLHKTEFPPSASLTSVSSQRPSLKARILRSPEQVHTV